MKDIFLWKACSDGLLDEVKYLISKGCNVDYCVQDQSCLMEAAEYGHLDVVMLLLKYVTQYPSDIQLEFFWDYSDGQDFVFHWITSTYFKFDHQERKECFKAIVFAKKNAYLKLLKIT